MKMEDFFDAPKESSLVKTAIVTEYFPTWANIILNQVRKSRDKKLGYVDLYAGPGRYEDGTDSTPLIVLKHAIADQELRQMLVSVFNDKESQNVEALKKAVSGIPLINSLAHAPEFHALRMEDDIGRIFAKMAGMPCLFFIDPWGYKGLTLECIRTAIRDWASECLFFFNYNRINAALTNPTVEHHIHWLFGEERLNHLRRALPSIMNPEARERAVIEEMTKALNSAGGKYVVTFRFKGPGGHRTTHHLFFVTKHPKGYEVMKDIMGSKSSACHQGVPSFEYNPARADDPTLFELFRPLDKLKEQLLDVFAGRTLPMLDIFLTHSVGTNYTKGNYKAVLAQLADDGCIEANHPRGRRNRTTFADDVQAVFPTKEP